MAEVIRVYRESLQGVRLVGKRYGDQDRGAGGGYSHKWAEWFRNGYFLPLEGLPQLPDEMNGYLGCMRVTDQFEYWIGTFTTDLSAVPPGFDHVDIPASEWGVCWLKGKETSGELFGHEAHKMCVENVEKQGWQWARQGWFVERYHCPRFTDPDEQGNVVLDYCILLEP